MTITVNRRAAKKHKHTVVVPGWFGQSKLETWPLYWSGGTVIVPASS